MDYSELVKNLRYCADMDTYCSSCKYVDENCEQKMIAKAADAIEELKKDLERSKEYESFWENAAKTCLHYIYNKHDRGDDSLCDVLMTEPPRVDPCADCVHYPPSSTDGKPCCACDPANPLTNCHEAKGEIE